MDVSWRIRELLESHGITQVQLSAAVGLSQSYVNAVCNGKKIPLENIALICNYIGISIAEFFSPFTDSKQQIPDYLKDFYKETRDIQADEVSPLLSVFTILKSRRVSTNAEAKDTHFLHLSGDAAAGPPLYSPNDFNDEEIEVPEKYDDKERFFLIRARGDSMEPKIHPGDMVIVQRDTPPLDGQIALVRLAGLADDEYTIKRVYYSNGEVTLKSFNAVYPPIIYAADTVRQCDKVVHILPPKKAPAK